MSSSIILMGMPGSGKSYWAKYCASYFQMPYCDLDEYIFQQTSRTPAQVIREDGEAVFRSLETHALNQLKSALNTSTWISLGGGTPCFAQNMSIIQSMGRSIYLKATPDFLWKQLQQDSTIRPLLQPFDIETITTLLSTREQYFLQADIILNAENLNISKFIKIHSLC